MEPRSGFWHEKGRGDPGAHLLVDPGRVIETRAGLEEEPVAQRGDLRLGEEGARVERRVDVRALAVGELAVLDPVLRAGQERERVRRRDGVDPLDRPGTGLAVGA
jgi:hypothetical protein